MARVRILIEGRVQGVGFRYHTCAQAGKLGVTGWVRNLSDGRVEALIEGPDEAVEAMVEWCRRGPAAARVDRVAIAGRDQAAPAEHTGFSIR